MIEMRPAMGKVIRATPQEEATPLPPSILKKTGQLCPMIQASPAIPAHGCFNGANGPPGDAAGENSLGKVSEERNKAPLGAHGSEHIACTG